jgi:two-component system, chemotaxis family, CheB/CheR fusion protein
MAKKKSRQQKRPSRARPAPVRRTGRSHARRAAASGAVAPEAQQPSAFTIVGVGASAGGLEALIPLLKGLPSSAGLAVVLVQHLAPQHDSALPTLLTAHTSMPVIQVTDNLEVRPNHVYVIPPNVQMGITGSRLHLKPRPADRSQYTPIDAFFRALAESSGTRAIGVILSGTGSDGALGVRHIKAAGGITLAQKPDTARYDGMPRAAIATGMVDLVLAPERIGAKLASVPRHPYLLELQPTGSLNETDLQRVFDLLRPISGVDFKHYKLPTIRRRLLRRMALHRLTEVGDYVRLLQSTPSEVRGLYQDLLIHVTRFFREPESFDALSREVLPELIDGRASDQPIRVWVSGCATRIHPEDSRRRAHPALRH